MDAKFQEKVYSHQAVWDGLWKGETIGRIAVAVIPSAESVQRVRERYSLDSDDTGYRPENWNEQWRESLLNELYIMQACTDIPGDQCPAIGAPRFVHGQSQGITDIFGGRPEKMTDGMYYSHPLAQDVNLVSAISVRELDTCGPQKLRKGGYSITRGSDVSIIGNWQSQPSQLQTLRECWLPCLEPSIWTVQQRSGRDKPLAGLVSTSERKDTIQRKVKRLSPGMNGITRPVWTGIAVQHRLAAGIDRLTLE